MKVEELMTRDVRTCSPDDDLAVPARIMWEHDCGCVPVVDQDGRAVGMITDRDLCMAAYTQGRTLKDIRVASVMARDVRACRAGDPLIMAQDAMRAAQVRRLPVLDTDERLVGVISLNDLACELVSERSSRAQAVTAEELALTLAAVSLHRLAAQPPSVQELGARPVEPQETLPPAAPRRPSAGRVQPSTSRPQA